MESLNASARATLRNQLINHFSAAELRTLCFDLGVDDESLRSDDKNILATQMILHFERRDLLSDLLIACAKHRPNVVWDVDSFVYDEASSASRDTQGDHAWWRKLPTNSHRSDQVDGDVIIAHIGTGATGVAVGKNIKQTINQVLGPSTPEDQQIIEQHLDQISMSVVSREDYTAKMVAFQLKLLRGELTKTSEGETPSASTITQVSDWLLDNALDLSKALADLFALPAVGRVLARAGEPALVWVKRRFE